MSTERPLFAGPQRLLAYLDERRRAAARELEAWSVDGLLATPADEIVEYLVEKYSVECPVVDQTRIGTLGSRRVESEVPDGFDGYQLQQLRYRDLSVPYTGDADVFLLRTDVMYMGASPSPAGQVRANDIVITIATVNVTPSAEDVLAAARVRVAEIERRLSWSRNEIAGYNETLRSQLTQRVEGRRDEELAERDLEASLPVPLSLRQDTSVFDVPLTRRLASIRRKPATSQTTFRPEYEISDASYEDAIDLLIHMRNALERSSTFLQRRDEEAIRNLLLVTLNAHFMGTATGETFNCTGKTDILIRVDDKNVFIGECKIWRGKTSIDEAIDQVLRYQAWRDCKAAIPLFVFNADPTQVITKAVERLANHPNCVRQREARDAAERVDFDFHALNDSERRIRVALLPFVLR